MEPVCPEFLPDPSLSRAEMEELQREVAAAARFADDLPFDPATVSLADPDGTADAETTLSSFDSEGRSPSGNRDASRPSDSETPPESRAAGTAGSGEGERDGGDRPLVAGVDQAFLDDRAVGAVVAMRGGRVVERVHAVTELSIPYIPGLLSFREGAPILSAVAELDADPDLFVFDGSGRIHFRQAGLATHMGVLFDAPAVGVAKSLLCGRPRESVDGRPAGWRTPIEADGDVDAPAGTVIGHAYQSRQYDATPKINPLYVSPGHRLSAETATDLVARLGGEYKLPEPTRLADAYADEAKADVE